MNKWFRKGNSRRFYRIDMPVRAFIVPSSPLEHRDIYATGIDYFPSSFTVKVKTLKFNTLNWAGRIQEHNEVLMKIFKEIIEFIEFFGECAHSIAEGQNPRLDPTYWMRIKTHLEGFKTARLIEPSSPKTYRYIMMIEEKYLAFLKRMVKSIENSTRDHFDVEGRLPMGFQLDEMMATFDNPKFIRIPLVQTLLNLSAYMDTYLEAYRQINDDNCMRQYPKEWRLQHANVSASGIALHLGKRFPPNGNVDVLLYFPEDERVLKFDGNIVDMRTDEKSQSERVAINFEFPDGDQQEYLQIQIQKQEVKECMDIAL